MSTYMLVIIVIDFGRVIWRWIVMVLVEVWCALWSVVGVCGETSSGVDVSVWCGVWCWCGACMMLVQWCGGGWSSGSVVVVVEVEAIRSRPATAGFPLRDVTLIFIWRWGIAAQILILLWWYFICWPHSMISLKLSVIFIHIITQSCSVSSSFNLSPSRLSQV